MSSTLRCCCRLAGFFLRAFSSFDLYDTLELFQLTKYLKHVFLSIMYIFIIANFNPSGLSVIHPWFFLYTAFVVVGHFFLVSRTQLKARDSIFTCVALVHH